jgi:hypothetical protein
VTSVSCAAIEGNVCDTRSVEQGAALRLINSTLICHQYISFLHVVNPENYGFCMRVDRLVSM